MKKHPTLHAIVLCNIFAVQMVNAQLLRTESSFCVIPKNVTSSGNSFLMAIDANESFYNLTIYDEALQVAKVITQKSPTLTTTKYLESTKIMPTGAKIQSCSHLMSTTLADKGINLTAYTTVDELTAVIREKGLGSTYQAFVDAEGYLSVVETSLDKSGYFYPKWFGTKYPQRYYSTWDGEEVLMKNIKYDFVYPEDKLVWVKNEDTEQIIEEGTTHGSDYIPAIRDFEFTDYDNGSQGTLLFVSQTLFNDDNDWEIVVPDIGGSIRQNTPFFSGETEDGIVLTREVYYEPCIIAFNFISENGEVLFQIKATDGQSHLFLDDVWKLNGKLYAHCEEQVLDADNNYCHYDIIYEINTETNSVKMMQKVKGENRFAKIADGKIYLSMGNDEKIQEVMLTNAAGQLIYKKEVPAGFRDVQINAPHLNSGIYNLTLLRDGKPQKNQKIRIR